jgi:hypothetical protein
MNTSPVIDIAGLKAKYGTRGIPTLVETLIRLAPEFPGDCELARMLGLAMADLESALASVDAPVSHGLTREEHLATVRLQLMHRWQEAPRALLDSDRHLIEKEAAMLMHERGFPGLVIKTISKPGGFFNLFELSIEKKCDCCVHTPSGKGLYAVAGSFEPGRSVGCKIVRSWHVSDNTATSYAGGYKYRPVIINFTDGESISATEVEKTG